MTRRGLLFVGHTAFIVLLVLKTCNGRDDHLCTSSCGNLPNISEPFRLKTDPKKCGDKRYTLSCEDNSAVLYLYSGKYYVQEINYLNFTIRLVDASLDRNDCHTFPQFPLTTRNFSIEDPYLWYEYKWTGSEYEPKLLQSVIFINCANPLNSSLFVDTGSCNNSLELHSYVHIGGGLEVSELMSMCSIEMMAMLPADKNYENMAFIEIHRELAYRFELSWHNKTCGNRTSCFFDSSNDKFQCRTGVWNLSVIDHKFLCHYEYEN